MIPAIRSFSFNVICHAICIQARLGMALDSLINSTTAAVNASLVHRSPDHQCRLFSRMQDLSSSFVGFRLHSVQENVKKCYEGCSISAVHALVLQSPPTASLSLLHPQDLVSDHSKQDRTNRRTHTHTHRDACSFGLCRPTLGLLVMVTRVAIKVYCCLTALLKRLV